MTEKDKNGGESFMELDSSNPPPPSYSNDGTTTDPNQTGTCDTTNNTNTDSSSTPGLSSTQSSTVTLPNVANAPTRPAIPLNKKEKRQSATATPIANKYGTTFGAFKAPPPPPPVSGRRKPVENPFGDQNRAQTPQPVDTVMSEASGAPITMPQPHLSPSPGPNAAQQFGGNTSQSNQTEQGTPDLTPNVSAPVSTGAFHAQRGMYNPAATGATPAIRNPPSRSSSMNTNVNMPNPSPTGPTSPSVHQHHSFQGGALNSAVPPPVARSGPHSNQGHTSASQTIYSQSYTQPHSHHQAQPPAPVVYSNPVPPPQFSQPQIHPEVHMELQQQRRVLNFYNREDPYYEFTNFSPDRVMYNGRDYPTSEHAFQAQKFLDHRPGLAEHIRTVSDNPRDAFNEARRFQPEWRTDWHSVKIQKMEEILYEKFARQPRLRRLLTETGDAELIEDSPYDPYWGIGRDRKGENQLGKALERLRTKLQAEDAARAAKRNQQMQPVNQQQYYGQSPTNFGQQPTNMQQTTYAQPQNPMNTQPMMPYSSQMIQQTPSSYPVPSQYSAQAQGMATPNPGDGMYGLS